MQLFPCCHIYCQCMNASTYSAQFSVHIMLHTASPTTYTVVAYSWHIYVHHYILHRHCLADVGAPEQGSPPKAGFPASVTIYLFLYADVCSHVLVLHQANLVLVPLGTVTLIID